VALRLLWWLALLAWRVAFLTLALAGSVLWLLAWPLRRRPAAPVSWPSADEFYRSSDWRRLRFDMLERNRGRYGVLTCECCLATTARQWHVDHVRPRSSHPELALEPANLQVLCQDCNVGKGIRQPIHWRHRVPA
jgi:5-methylcytosine-specific restriction endonuclease McrA